MLHNNHNQMSNNKIPTHLYLLAQPQLLLMMLVSIYIYVYIKSFNSPTLDAPLNLFAAAQQHAQQQQQQQQQQQPLGADLASFRNTPHFQQIRQLVQTNPGLLQPLLQSIGQSNPELIRAINADPNGFLQAFLEGAEGEEGGPETTTIQVTAEEREAIERVK